MTERGNKRERKTQYNKKMEVKRRKIKEIRYYLFICSVIPAFTASFLLQNRMFTPVSLHKGTHNPINIHTSSVAPVNVNLSEFRVFPISLTIYTRYQGVALSLNLHATALPDLPFLLRSSTSLSHPYVTELYLYCTGFYVHPYFPGGYKTRDVKRNRSGMKRFNQYKQNSGHLSPGGERQGGASQHRQLATWFTQGGKKKAPLDY